MDDGSSETCLDWLNNMKFKNIVWFIKAINTSVLLEYTPLIKLRQNYIWDSGWLMVSIFSRVIQIADHITDIIFDP